jgi:NAD-dependent deacetylase
MSVMRAQPNAGHRAIATLTQHVQQLTLVTQNVDDLHERAGSEAVIHLHGSLFAPRCFACRHPAALPAGIPNEPEGGTHRASALHTLRRQRAARRRVVRRDAARSGVAAGVRGRPIVRPAAVVGTSSLVFPAAQIPIDAHLAGARVVQVNPNPTYLDAIADFNLRGTAASVLSHLAGRAFPPA